jgi:hypothetical protein
MTRTVAGYFNAVETDVKVVFRLLPVLWTATMIATEMPAAMRPYSIAVAPDSSRKKERSFDMQDSLAEVPVGFVAVWPPHAGVLRVTSEKKMLWNFQFYHDNASDCVSAERRKTTGRGV